MKTVVTRSSLVLSQSLSLWDSMASSASMEGSTGQDGAATGFTFLIDSRGNRMLDTRSNYLDVRV